MEPNLGSADGSFSSHKTVEQLLTAHHLATAESARTRGRKCSQVVARKVLRCHPISFEIRLFETMRLVHPGAAWRSAFYVYVCVHVCVEWFHVWVLIVCELRPTGRVEETTVSSYRRGSSSQTSSGEAVARKQTAATIVIKMRVATCRRMRCTGTATTS